MLQQKEDLVDLQQVQIHSDLPVKDRMAKFIRDVKDPYSFKVDDLVVSVVFNSRGKKLSEAIASLVVPD